MANVDFDYVGSLTLEIEVVAQSHELQDEFLGKNKISLCFFKFSQKTVCSSSAWRHHYHCTADGLREHFLCSYGVLKSFLCTTRPSHFLYLWYTRLITLAQLMAVKIHLFLDTDEVL